VIVEIGSWLGKSTVWLARGSLAGAGMKAYAVDPHRDSDAHRWQQRHDMHAEFLAGLRLAGVEETVVPLVMTSAAAARRLQTTPPAVRC